MGIDMDDMGHNATEEEQFALAISAIPKLKDAELYDPDVARMVFHTLRNFRLDMARDPLVAASFLVQIVPRVDTGVLFDVIARLTK